MSHMKTLDIHAQNADPERSPQAMQRKKPPIGIIPECLWLEQRANALMEAIERYLEAGECVPAQWPDELSRINEALKKEPSNGHRIHLWELVEIPPQLLQRTDTRPRAWTIELRVEDDLKADTPMYAIKTVDYRREQY